MSAQLTMEDVGTSVSTVSAPFSVPAEVASDCPAIENPALVISLSVYVSIFITLHACTTENIYSFLQILMNVLRQVPTTVLITAVTLLAPTPVPATVDTDWIATEDLALVRKNSST